MGREGNSKSVEGVPWCLGWLSLALPPSLCVRLIGLYLGELDEGGVDGRGEVEEVAEVNRVSSLLGQKGRGEESIYSGVEYMF